MGVGGHHEGGIWKRGRTFTWDRDHYTEGGDVSVRRRSVFFFQLLESTPIVRRSPSDGHPGAHSILRTTVLYNTLYSIYFSQFLYKIYYYCSILENEQTNGVILPPHYLIQIS